MTDIVSCDIDAGVAFVRMNREEKHNAFHRELSLAVSDTMDNLEADDEVRCIVLTGVGKAFSAGADMTEALASFESGGRGGGMARAVVQVAALTTPTVAPRTRPAVRWGAAAAPSSDLRRAPHPAGFRFPGASYGLVVGGSQLPRIVGGPKAKELILTARVIDAQEAERIGLVNQLVPHGQLEDAAWKMAREIAKQSPAAVRWSKAVIDAATTVEKGGALEIEANRELRGSPDHISRFRAATHRVAGGGQEGQQT